MEAWYALLAIFAGNSLVTGSMIVLESVFKQLDYE